LLHSALAFPTKSKKSDGGADLSFANLLESNLKYANLFGADLTEANLEGANLTGADLTGVIGYNPQ